MFSMARLNRSAAKLMQKYKAHGATDVTGFGILGHASNLVESQVESVNFHLHTLPVFKHMVSVYNKCGINFKLLDGYSAETSGMIIFFFVFFFCFSCKYKCFFSLYFCQETTFILEIAS